MKKHLVFVLAVVALAAPAQALAGGVVLKVQPARHLVAVARTPTNIAIVHTTAASHLRVGERVSLSAHTLRNGTLAASAVTVLGHVQKVHFRGRLLGHSYGRLSVLAGGAVITVHTGSRSVASARDGSPPTGSQVGVTATVGSSGQLEDGGVTVFSPTSPGGRIEGQLTLGTGSITVTSDAMSLVITVPSGFDLSTFTNGQDVLATFAQQSDGSLLLTALSGDDSAQQADHQCQDGQGGNGNGTGGDGGQGSGSSSGDGGGSESGGSGGGSGSGSGDGGGGD